MVAMNRIIVFLILNFPFVAQAAELIEVEPKGCVKIKDIVSMSQVSIQDSKISLKKRGDKLGADTVYLKEAEDEFVTAHGLPDTKVYIASGIAFKCSKL